MPGDRPSAKVFGKKAVVSDKVMPKKPRGRRSADGIKKPTTTMKVSRRVISEVEKKSRPSESIDDTLKRLLKLVVDKPRDKEPLPLATTIKVSRMVMDYIQEEAKENESRDNTLSRLLGIKQDDGNVREGVVA